MARPLVAQCKLQRFTMEATRQRTPEMPIAFLLPWETMNRQGVLRVIAFQTLVLQTLVLQTFSGTALADDPQLDLRRVQYNNPALVVDLGVGLWAWPLPMDWDRDGDYDLIVSCPDKPYNGTYFFENTSGDVKLPVFKPGVKVGQGMNNVQVSHVDGLPRVLQSSHEFFGFLGNRFGSEIPSERKPVYREDKIHEAKGRDRFNVWSYVDYDGDGTQDIMVGADDWGDYGWDDGYDERGKWKRGPLHGYVYILRNAGTTVEPQYEKPFRVQGGGVDVNVYGNPQPNMADFDGDGDLDLVCGEFLDGFTYFENTGSRTTPIFSAGKYLTDGEQEDSPARADDHAERRLTGIRTATLTLSAVTKTAAWHWSKTQARFATPNPFLSSRSIFDRKRET